MKKKRARGERIPAKPLKIWLETQERGTKADFCRELGISQAILTNWFARNLLPADRLHATAAAMHISDAEYRRQAGLGGTSLIRAGQATTAGHINIERLSAGASMGPGHEMDDTDHVVERVTLVADWVKQTLPRLSSVSNLKVISAYGDSMLPTFNDGDLLLIDTGIKQVDIDGVFVLRANGRLYIKRVRQKLEGSFEVSSDNPLAGTPEPLSGKYKVDVLGRVVWAWNGRKL